MNYVHGLPFYSVSLALEHEGELLVGSVYDPLRDECFMAVRGGGAQLNGQPIHSSTVADMSQAMAVVGFPAVVRPNAPDLLVFMEACPNPVAAAAGLGRPESVVRGGRPGGCVLVVLDEGLGHCGRGPAAVREAGGVITTPTGGPLVLDDARFAATANPALHTQFTALVQHAIEARPQA